MEIRFYLNGKETVVNAQPERLLVDVLREDLHLTGTKRGCGEGECGTCTVLLNDKAVHACMTMIAQVNGHRVRGCRIRPSHRTHHPRLCEQHGHSVRLLHARHGDERRGPAAPQSRPYRR